MKGSVVKKGTKFYIVVDAGRDALGKRKQRWISGFNTKKEAERELPRVLVKLQDGELLENNNVTIETFALDWFKNKVKRDKLAPTTAAGYENIILNHIIPTIGSLKLQEVKAYNLQKYFDIKYDSLASYTLSSHRRLIKSLFLSAIDMELIDKNPLDKVKLPRSKKQEAKVYNIDECIELLDKVQKNRTISIPVILALLLGMRRGECLGLRWSDIDFENKQITIRQNLEYVKGEYHFGEPKTDKSKRTIAFPEMLVPILREHKKWQMEMMLRTSYHWNNTHDLVCTSVKTGGPLRPTNVSDGFRNFLKKNNMRKIRYHDLRHSNASIMVAANIPAKVASNRLGHSSIGITLDLYSHVLQSVDTSAAEKINELLAK